MDVDNVDDEQVVVAGNAPKLSAGADRDADLGVPSTSAGIAQGHGSGVAGTPAKFINRSNERNEVRTLEQVREDLRMSDDDDEEVFNGPGAGLPQQPVGVLGASG